jgi:hypothetical protein
MCDDHPNHRVALASPHVCVHFASAAKLTAWLPLSRLSAQPPLSLLSLLVKCLPLCWPRATLPQLHVPFPTPRFVPYGLLCHPVFCLSYIPRSHGSRLSTQSFPLLPSLIKGTPPVPSVPVVMRRRSRTGWRGGPTEPSPNPHETHDPPSAVTQQRGMSASASI